MKVHAKARAIELRTAGHSYNYIAPLVGVSKSTLSAWLATVPYTPNAETCDRIGKALAASGAAKAKLKQNSLEMAWREALSIIGKCSKRDLFMAGLGLYIGEGSKTTNQTVFVNANPAIVRFMVRWFIETLNLKIENIRIRIHLYPDSDIQNSIKFHCNISMWKTN